jgi:hypothetical protein
MGGRATFCGLPSRGVARMGFGLGNDAQLRHCKKEKARCRQGRVDGGLWMVGRRSQDIVEGVTNDPLSTPPRKRVDDGLSIVDG